MIVQQVHAKKQRRCFAQKDVLLVKEMVFAIFAQNQHEKIQVYNRFCYSFK